MIDTASAFLDSVFSEVAKYYVVIALFILLFVKGCRVHGRFIESVTIKM